MTRSSLGFEDPAQLATELSKDVDREKITASVAESLTSGQVVIQLAAATTGAGGPGVAPFRVDAGHRT
jgi:nicotinamide mononucleotide (NMN) deamidase PncC